MSGKNVTCGLVIEIISNENFCVVYKLLEIYNIKGIIYISLNGTGNINARTAKKFRGHEEYSMIVAI